MTSKLKACVIVTSEILTCSVIQTMVTNYVQTKEPSFLKTILVLKILEEKYNLISEFFSTLYQAV